MSWVSRGRRPTDIHSDRGVVGIAWPSPYRHPLRPRCRGYRVAVALQTSTQTEVSWVSRGRRPTDIHSDRGVVGIAWPSPYRHPLRPRCRGYRVAVALHTSTQTEVWYRVAVALQTSTQTEVSWVSRGRRPTDIHSDRGAVGIAWPSPYRHPLRPRCRGYRVAVALQTSTQTEVSWVSRGRRPTDIHSDRGVVGIAWPSPYRHPLRPRCRGYRVAVALQTSTQTEVLWVSRGRRPTDIHSDRGVVGIAWPPPYRHPLRPRCRGYRVAVALQTSTQTEVSWVSRGRRPTDIHSDRGVVGIAWPSPYRHPLRPRCGIAWPSPYRHPLRPRCRGYRVAVALQTSTQTEVWYRVAVALQTSTQTEVWYRVAVALQTSTQTEVSWVSRGRRPTDIHSDRGVVSRGRRPTDIHSDRGVVGIAWPSPYRPPLRRAALQTSTQTPPVFLYVC